MVGWAGEGLEYWGGGGGGRGGAGMCNVLADWKPTKP